jgi:hypothetical protein
MASQTCVRTSIPTWPNSGSRSWSFIRITASGRTELNLGLGGKTKTLVSGRRVRISYGTTFRTNPVTVGAPVCAIGTSHDALSKTGSRHPADAIRHLTCGLGPTKMARLVPPQYAAAQIANSALVPRPRGVPAGTFSY